MVNSFNNKKRILICSNFYPPAFIGGAELVAHFQAKELNKQDLDVFVLSTKIDDYKKPYTIVKEEYENIPVFRIIVPPQDFELSAKNFINPKIDKIFKEVFYIIKPHIVHTHNIACFSINILLIAKQFGAKTVSTLHDHWAYCYKNTMMNSNDELCEPEVSCEACSPDFYINNVRYPVFLRQSYIRYVFNQVDLLLSPSFYLSQCYIKSKIYGKSFHVLWNGLEVDRYSNVTKKTSDQIRFTFIGYVGEHKGVQVLLETLPYLDLNKVVINIVGTGNLVEKCETYVKDNGFSNHVRFWGRIPNEKMEFVYAETDIVILPSIWPENQPVSITEGMASGCPVITTNIGGSAELVEDNVNGYLVEFGNSKKLSEAMNHFIQQPSKIQEMGRNAKKFMADNSVKQQVQKLKKLYSLIEKNEKPAKELAVLINNEFDYDLLFQTNHFYQGEGLNMIPVEWLPENSICEKNVFWLHPKAKVLEKFYKMVEKYQSRILVPEESKTLKDLCREKKCGLFYQDALEAAVCLEYMEKNFESFLRV